MKTDVELVKSMYDDAYEAQVTLTPCFGAFYYADLEAKRLTGLRYGLRPGELTEDMLKEAEALRIKAIGY